jgi:hypothetical protein
MSDFPVVKSDVVDNVDDVLAKHINNLEDKVGINGDTEPTSLDYMLKTGWISASETWSYVSVDDPTGVFRINADVTAKYSVGMRIKFVNGGNTIYGIITVVSAYNAVDAGYTHITFLHQIDPTDSLALYLMADSAITANYYSTQKVPFGFPSAEQNWTTYALSVSNLDQADPSSGTWYNLGTMLITVPIGKWKLEYNVSARCTKSTATLGMFVTLSDANNSESDANMTCYGETTTTPLHNAYFRYKYISLTAKDIFYLNAKIPTTSYTLLRFAGASSPTIIRAICAYL